MSTIVSQITSLTIVYLTVYSGADQRKYQSSASLAFVRGIHRGPVNSPHKGPVTRKCFHLMTSSWNWEHRWLHKDCFDGLLMIQNKIETVVAKWRTLMVWWKTFVITGFLGTISRSHLSKRSESRDWVSKWIKYGKVDPIRNFIIMILFLHCMPEFSEIDKTGISDFQFIQRPDGESFTKATVNVVWWSWNRPLLINFKVLFSNSTV